MAAHPGDFHYQDDLADVRVLMQNCVSQGGSACKFIIATNDDLSDVRKDISTIFQKMKTKIPVDEREKFVLEVWDDTGLLKVERELGLKV